MDDVTLSLNRIKGLAIGFLHILLHGAIAYVTGSPHQLRISVLSRFLVDCDLFQGGLRSHQKVG